MNYRLFLSISLLCLAAVGGGCGTSNQSPTSPSLQSTTTRSETAESSLQAELERTYEATRALSQDPTPDRYLAAIDTTGSDSEMIPEIRSGWAQRARIFAVTMPPLTGEQARFIQIRTQEDWASYDVLISLGEDRVMLRSQRFHKTPTGWKIGIASAQSVPQTEFTDFNRDRMRAEISNTPSMRVIPSSER